MVALFPGLFPLRHMGKSLGTRLPTWLSDPLTERHDSVKHLAMRLLHTWRDHSRDHGSHTRHNHGGSHAWHDSWVHESHLVRSRPLLLWWHQVDIIIPGFPWAEEIWCGVKQQRGTVIHSTEFVREEARFSCNSLLLTENFQTASNKSQNSEKEARYVQWSVSHTMLQYIWKSAIFQWTVHLRKCVH